MMRKFINLFSESTQSFQGQESGEQVVMILRQHLFTLSSRLTLIFLAAIVPMLIKLAFSEPILLKGYSSLFLFISSLWYAFLWLGAFYILTLYALNTVIITNRRIIENEQAGFFNRKVAELHVFRVQDVSVHTEGFFETMFSFGDVLVQTAAAEREFHFKNIPHPERAKDAIMQVVSSQRSAHNLS